jgi:hypothetical protein
MSAKRNKLASDCLSNRAPHVLLSRKEISVAKLDDVDDNVLLAHDFLSASLWFPSENFGANGLLYTRARIAPHIVTLVNAIFLQSDCVSINVRKLFQRIRVLLQIVCRFVVEVENVVLDYALPELAFIPRAKTPMFLYEEWFLFAAKVLE